MSQLGEVIYACADAESAQRGFLLTDKKEYLAPFEAARVKGVFDDRSPAGGH